MCDHLCCVGMHVTVHVCVHVLVFMCLHVHTLRAPPSGTEGPGQPLQSDRDEGLQGPRLTAVDSSPAKARTATQALSQAWKLEPSGWPQQQQLWGSWDPAGTAWSEGS